MHKHVTTLFRTFLRDGSKKHCDDVIRKTRLW